MPKAVQIVFGLIGLALIVYIAILGMTAFFDWINPGGGSGRVARLTTGAIVGLGVTVLVIAFRRFRN
jgi:hypothetical protein